MQVRAIGLSRVGGAAVIVTVLIAALAGAALAQGEEAPRKTGKVEGSWEVTQRLVESVPVGQQTSDDAPEGPSPSDAMTTFQTQLERCGRNFCFDWAWNADIVWSCELTRSGRRFTGQCSFGGAPFEAPGPQPLSLRVTGSQRTVDGVMATEVAGTMDWYDWIVTDLDTGALAGWRVVSSELAAVRLDTPPTPTTTTTITTTSAPTTTTLPPTMTATTQPHTTSVPATTTTTLVAAAPVSESGGTDRPNGGDGTAPPGVSAVVSSVNPVKDVSTDPLVIATNLLLAALLVLLMPFPPSSSTARSTSTTTRCLDGFASCTAVETPRRCGLGGSGCGPAGGRWVA